MKRIALFLVTNVAVVVVLGIVASLLGVNRYLTANGLNLGALGSERRLTASSNAFYRDEREAHRLIETGAVDVRSMITHRLPLERYAEAFDLLLRASREAYKVVFDMDRQGA